MNEKILLPPLPTPPPQKLLRKAWHIPSPSPAEFSRCKYVYSDFWSFRRMIYWADHPQGDIGVSFVDPIEAYSDHEQCRGLDCSAFMSERDNCDFLKNLFETGKVLNVASNSEDELGRLLAADSIKPFSGHHQHWMTAFDKGGNRIDDVLLYWRVPNFSGKERILCYDGLFDDGFDDYRDDIHDSEEVVNTFTNCPFNYLYINRILSDPNCLEGIKQYNYFTDGEIVNTRFGYYSPAYALALLKSLQKHEMLSVLRDFNTFRRYEPIDPITSLCKRIAYEKFKNVLYGKEIERARDFCHDYSNLDRLVEIEDAKDEYEEDSAAWRAEEERDREYWEDLTAPDDPDPYYIEMEYWNTH